MPAVSKSLTRAGPIAWKEMIRFETVAGERPLLKLCWRGHRGDKEVFAWFDKLMTRLTGKMHKGVGKRFGRTLRCTRAVEAIIQRRELRRPV